MKTNDLKDALAVFLSRNPDLPPGEDAELPVKKKLPTLHVSIDKKGRNGKIATLIDGFTDNMSEEVASLSKELKKILGVGGSHRDKEILIQGNLLDKVKKVLIEKGYKVK